MHGTGVASTLTEQPYIAAARIPGGVLHTHSPVTVYLHEQISAQMQGLTRQVLWQSQAVCRLVSGSLRYVVLSSRHGPFWALVLVLTCSSKSAAHKVARVWSMLQRSLMKSMQAAAGMLAKAGHLV